MKPKRAKKQQMSMELAECEPQDLTDADAVMIAKQKRSLRRMTSFNRTKTGRLKMAKVEERPSKMVDPMSSADRTRRTIGSMVGQLTGQLMVDEDPDIEYQSKCEGQFTLTFDAELVTFWVCLR